MSRYINVEEISSLFNEEYKRTMKLIEQGETHLNNLAEGFLEADQVIFRIPAADVVEVEPLCKRIKADLEEANEMLADGRCMSESAKAFQQGRIFAHKFDLLQIAQERKKDE